MTRLARVVFILLVGATVAAFFTAQRLKGEPAVARVIGLKHVFSPNGDRFKDINRFLVELRERAEIRVDVVDASGDAVRRLADDAVVSPQKPLSLRWDGRTDEGKIVADGRYRVRVTLRREGRSVTVPRTTLVDTEPPRPRVKSIKPGPIVGPVAGPVQIEVGSVSRRLSKRARIYRMGDGESRVVAELPLVTDTRTLTWNGQVNGKPAPPGMYVVQVSARDRGGNEGATPAHIPPERGDARGHPTLVVRTIAAEPPARPVTAGRKVRVNVDARGRPYRWRLRRLGETKPVKQRKVKARRPVELTAPQGDSGLYLLELTAGQSTTTVPLLVQSTTRAKMLVVVPMMTWLGTQQGDEDHDGVVNDFTTGEAVPWPRVQPGGLPADLLDNVAPLLRFLDAAGIRYDLTSDLDLALSRSPRASDRTGVLLAGSERWIPRPYARRLREYVQNGGRVASFGTEALRRGVTLRRNPGATGGRLVRPTQLANTDAFGTRLQPLRKEGSPVTLTIIGGEPDYGLLTGFDGELGGFTQLEESDAPGGERGSLLAALGVETAPEQDDATTDELPPPARPALAATKIGDGVYIRVGLPGWTHRLSDRQVGQITLNIADILRGVKTRIHTIPRG